MDKIATLTSLAMLKVNSDTAGRDYVDYIVPFIGFVLNTHQPNPVTAATVQGLLKSEFGLSIPQYPTEYALHRLADQKYLRRENYAYHIAKPVPTANIETRRESLRTQHAAVVDRLRTFAAGREQVWSNDEASDVLLSYLRRFSIDCLKAYTHGSPLPDTPPLDEQKLLTVSLFVKDIYEGDRENFECLITLVKGHMLANALVCSDLKSITRNFGGVVFYFDTPLLLRVLGLEGEPRSTAVAELLELLQRLKAHCAMFDHTFEETKGVIDGAEKNLDNPAARGRVIEEMRRRGTTKSDLLLISGRLEELLKQKGIGRRRTPKYEAYKRFQIDETLLQDAIADEVEYMNPRALEYDVNSVRSIYALRQGRAPVRLEDAGSVLVSSNAALARATFDYGREQESTREVSAVITDFSLANVAWLKAPLQAPGLPEIEVMAACYAALEPPSPLWKKYVAEIDKLRALGDISADDHQLLRHSLPARAALMNLTGGSEHEFSAGTVDDILDRMRSEMRRELERERDQMLQQERAKLGEAERTHDQARRQLEAATVEAEIRRKAAIEESDRLKRDREEATRHILRTAEHVGDWCRIGVTVFLALCVIVTLTVGMIKADTTRGKIAWFIGPLLGIGLLLAYLDNVHELSVKKLGTIVQKKASRVAYGFISRLSNDHSGQEPCGPSQL